MEGMIIYEHISHLFNIKTLKYYADWRLLLFNGLDTIISFKDPE